MRVMVSARKASAIFSERGGEQKVDADNFEKLVRRGEAKANRSRKIDVPVRF